MGLYSEEDSLSLHFDEAALTLLREESAKA